MRLAMGIEYDGRRYHGWQAQRSGVPSVQGALERALTRVAAHPIEVVCAGRTDRGVHASAQVVHFDTTAQRDVRGWMLGTVSHLPEDISVLWVKPVEEDFHARFSALAREYRYVLMNRQTRAGLLAGRVTWWHGALDVEAMRRAAIPLLGTHDFTSFRGKDCQARSPIRTLERLDISESKGFLYFDVRANAFLHHMVRNLVGTLLAVGEERRDENWPLDVLRQRHREAAGITAPADGLYLVHVEYPEHFNLKLSPVLPLFG
ncbi:MAG: tRNA pseudouridine(38-40) synthase TruA [Pseudomonadota bacterium]